VNARPLSFCARNAVNKYLMPTQIQFLVDQYGLANVAWFIRLLKRGTPPEQLASYCVPKEGDSRRDGVFRALQYAATLPDSMMPDEIKNALKP
jgi:hypothetical protein